MKAEATTTTMITIVYDIIIEAGEQEGRTAKPHLKTTLN